MPDHHLPKLIATIIVEFAFITACFIVAKTPPLTWWHLAPLALAVAIVLALSEFLRRHG